MTKISKGKRAHLIRVAWMNETTQGMMRSLLAPMPLGVSAYERMMADVRKDVSAALLAGVYP